MLNLAKVSQQSGELLLAKSASKWLSPTLSLNEFSFWADSIQNVYVSSPRSRTIKNPIIGYVSFKFQVQVWSNYITKKPLFYP